MRAVVIHAHGGPEVLQLEERPEPVLRDTDILVEVHATSVNPVDTKARQNASAQRKLPVILGYDRRHGKLCICALVSNLARTF
jgi:NADPH:quinone reductase-like Zn-dependent oxidoreductase